MIEFWMVKYFMVFVVFMELLTSFFIVKSMLYAYKIKQISLKEFIALLSIIVIIMFATMTVFSVIILKY